MTDPCYPFTTSENDDGWIRAFRISAFFNGDDSLQSMVYAEGAPQTTTHPPNTSGLNLSLAAVDEDVSSSDEAGIVRGEKCYCLGYLFHVAEATQRNEGSELAV